ncbi:MAG: hypothetical protein Kow00124_30430 [Anaerolineae bacterium]
MSERQVFLFMPQRRAARTARRALLAVVLASPVFLLIITALLLPRFILWVLVLLPPAGLALSFLPGLLIISADLSLGFSDLRIHVTRFWTIAIPIEAARVMLLTRSQPPWHVRAALGVRWESVTLVHVAGVEALKLCGLVLGERGMPLLVITPDHENADLLIKRLEHGKHPLARKPPGHTLPRRRRR